jgi:hypothetical protein
MSKSGLSSKTVVPYRLPEMAELLISDLKYFSVFQKVLVGHRN